MSVFRRLFLRLYNVIRPGPAERQLANEIDAHLALLEDRLRAHRVSRRTRRARCPAGSSGASSRPRNVQRDARSFVWLEDAGRDAHYAVRTLANAPWFTRLPSSPSPSASASVTIIYSVIHDVLLDPLPYRDSDRFVNVFVQDTQTGAVVAGAPALEFLDFKEEPALLRGCRRHARRRHAADRPERAEILRAVWVTPNFFDFMGLEPVVRAARPGRTTAGRMRRRWPC